MIVRSFLKWFENAPAVERAEAAQCMIRAYLDDQLGSDTRAEAEAALTLILDDPVISVRRALAWEMAASEAAPRHLAVALAHDCSEVSAPVLARSPLLRDPDLIDCIRVGDRLSHLAVAMRNAISYAVSTALAGTAGPEALVALLRNPGADIAARSFACMLDRHRDNADLRDALGAREDLPSPVRQALLATLSDNLLSFVSRSGWMGGLRTERMIGETKEAATIELAAHANDLGALVEHLRGTSQLTPALLLRSLLSGETALFGAALVSLTGFKPQRVAAIISSRGQGALPALYQKADLPRTLYPAFAAALGAIRELNIETEAGPVLRRPIIQRALGACLEQDEAEMQSVLALLRRFDSEAARLEARALTNSLMTEPAHTMIESSVLIDLELFAEAIAVDPDAPFTDDFLTCDDRLDASDTTPVVDSPFTDMELRGIKPLDADLGLLEPMFAPEEPEFYEHFEEDSAAESTADRDELMDLIDATFATIPETADEDLVALRVVESPAQMMDERFFASWEIRKRAA